MNLRNTRVHFQNKAHASSQKKNEKRIPNKQTEANRKQKHSKTQAKWGKKKKNITNKGKTKQKTCTKTPLNAADDRTSSTNEFPISPVNESSTACFSFSPCAPTYFCATSTRCFSLKCVKMLATNLARSLLDFVLNASCNC